MFFCVYFDVFDVMFVVVNMVVLIGYLMLCVWYMVDFDCVVSVVEIVVMVVDVCEVMVVGVFGVLLGIFYLFVVGVLMEELIDVCVLLCEMGGVFVMYLCDEIDVIIVLFDEVFLIGCVFDVCVVLLYYKVVGKVNYGCLVEMFVYIDVWCKL